MNKSLAIGIPLVVIAAGIGLIIWGINSTAPLSPKEDGSLTVAATIFPLADITENILGEAGSVVLIIPPGVSEHDFSISPQQVIELQSADAVLQVGLGLDDVVATQVQSATENQLAVYSVEKGITLREFGEQEEHTDTEHAAAGHGSVDPHYWLTATNAKIMAANIADILIKLDPDNQNLYKQNLAAYHGQLDALEQELQGTAQGLTQKHFIAMHDAWGYFAGHYGLELVGTYEPIEGREPSPTDLQELQELIREHGITTFYTEPQKASTAATRFFAEELDLATQVLDPVGGTAERGTYIDLMRANMAAIARGSQ